MRARCLQEVYDIYVFTILKMRSRIKVKNVTLVPFCKTDCFSTSHCSWVLMENALGWLVPSFTSLQNFRSKLSPRPRFTHSSFIPQKVVTWFLKAFNLLCELFRPILTRSFEPTNLPLVDSCSEWQKITASTKVDKASWAVAAMVSMNLSWPLISLTCSGDLLARGYKFGKAAVDGSECTDEWSYIKTLTSEVKSSHQMLVRSSVPIYYLFSSIDP